MTLSLEEHVARATIDRETAAKAAQSANARFGQWMPEQWLWLFIDEYDKMVSAPPALPTQAQQMESGE